MGPIENIDVVITWVDGNDPAWLAEKGKYEKQAGRIDESASGAVRFRDWDNVQYIFRGIERFMPWVRIVHFVTWGHVPRWLNTDAPHLHIVTHRDFIPDRYLPTFNSNTIDLNAYRIPGLAEHFISFNDDMFVIGPTVSTDFFSMSGLPRDMAVISPAPMFRGIMPDIETNNLGVLNDHFVVSDVKKHRRKWYTPLYGNMALRTMIFSRFKTIIGIFEPHVQLSFLCSTFETVWNEERELLDRTCSNQFRSCEDVNQWLMRQWQLMSGQFEPRRKSFAQLFDLSDDNSIALSALKSPGKLRLVCLNDTPAVTDFMRVKNEINTALEAILPEKSAYEK